MERSGFGAAPAATHHASAGEDLPDALAGQAEHVGHVLQGLAVAVELRHDGFAFVIALGDCHARI